MVSLSLQFNDRLLCCFRLFWISRYFEKCNNLPLELRSRSFSSLQRNNFCWSVASPLWASRREGFASLEVSTKSLSIPVASTSEVLSKSTTYARIGDGRSNWAASKVAAARTSSSMTTPTWSRWQISMCTEVASSGTTDSLLLLLSSRCALHCLSSLLLLLLRSTTLHYNLCATLIVCIVFNFSQQANTNVKITELK